MIQKRPNFATGSPDHCCSPPYIITMHRRQPLRFSGLETIGAQYDIMYIYIVIVYRTCTRGNQFKPGVRSVYIYFFIYLAVTGRFHRVLLHTYIIIYTRRQQSSSLNVLCTLIIIIYDIIIIKRQHQLQSCDTV